MHNAYFVAITFNPSFENEIMIDLRPYEYKNGLKYEHILVQSRTACFYSFIVRYVRYENTRKLIFIYLFLMEFSVIVSVSILF